MMKLTRKAVALAGAAAMMASCNHMKQIKHMPYPETQRTDVVDDYFGTKVADPYRWLEDDNSEATAAWVKAQNAVTQDYLSQIPFRDAIRGRLTQLWNYPKEGIPAKHGDAWYYFYNDGLQNQSVLYRTTAPGAQGEVFLNPNTLSDDGTVALSSVAFSKDGKWLFISASEGTSGTEILYKKVSEPKFRTLLPGFDADYALVECRDDRLYYITNKDAANNALMKVDLNDPSSITAVIPENEKSLLENVTAAGGYFFASYLQDAQSKVVQYGFDGKPVRDIELPGICTAAGFDGDDEAAEIYYSVSGYTAPATIYKLDVASGESTLFKAPDVNFDPALFTTEQVFYTSKDGTKVPMFITHRKDLKLDGKNPCYLYAYGGFQINRTPGFRPSAIMFVEQGGVFCEANLRGGSEYGEAWHKAGMLENKQNVFDDFIAAAEYLIANKYTSKDKLAIAGGSNGGLLVGACEVQRPDLYAVCLPAVGVMDMLRYHKFTIGWGWAVEYGSSENEEQFDYIYKYSPLHNIREGVQYPATLVTTADHDDRVVPAHSFKFTAQIQHCQAGDAPILIRIESKAGHGAGKPTSKRIDEEADTYAFLFQNIGVPYKPVAK